MDVKKTKENCQLNNEVKIIYVAILTAVREQNKNSKSDGQQIGQ